jgi:hypothetical protein
MAGPEFHQTVIGQRFLEGTMPRLVKSLDLLNEHLSRIAAALEARPAARRGLRLRLLSNGRVLRGSPESIVQQMYAGSIARDPSTLTDHVDALVEHIAERSGTRLNVADGDPSVRAKALLAALVSAGLAMWA